MLVIILLVASAFAFREDPSIDDEVDAVMMMRNDDTGESDSSDCVDCPSYVQLSASQKMDRLWGKIEADEYTDDEFPKNWISLSDGFIPETLGRLRNGTMPMFFDRFSDENPTHRLKNVHTFGSTAKVGFVAANTTGYTGMFTDGADYALIRLSMVTDWEQPCSLGKGCIKPSMAFKMLRDGDYSSNTVAQVNLGDGVGWNFNFFNYTQSTHLPSAHGLGAQFVKMVFLHAATETNGVGLQELASYGSNTKLSDINDPKVLFFVPSDDIKDRFSNNEHDPRTDFKAIASSTRLFDVYTADFKDKSCSAHGQPVIWDELGKSCPKQFLGHVVTKSRFVASAYEDHRLFFQHERITKGVPWRRKMCKTGVLQNSQAVFRMAGDFTRTCSQECGPNTEAVENETCPFSELEQ